MFLCVGNTHTPNESCALAKGRIMGTEFYQKCVEYMLFIGFICWECTNPCCNATTCTLTKESMCAEGECCVDCKIANATVMCRPKRDECDIPEYCTGNSAACPENVFAVNGLPCSNGNGYCYNGQCPRHEDQCIKMWGPGSVVGDMSCYSQNTRGAYFAYCSWPINGTYIGCQKQDVMCGKLFCSQGNDNPNYGRLVQFKNCKGTFFGDPMSDYGQVDAGTMCDDEKVCYQNQCVNVEVAYKSTNCSVKCSGHGVCNHKLECSCEPGWQSPYCNIYTTHGGADPNNEKGMKIGISVAVCIAFGAILTGLGICFMKRRKTQPRQTGKQPHKQHLPEPSTSQSSSTDATHGNSSQRPATTTSN